MINKLILLLAFFSIEIFSQAYPDQFYSYEEAGLISRIEILNGMEISGDGKSVILSEGIKDGYTVFAADSSEYPFDRGLPSWNGHVPNDKSSFRVLMRFYKNGLWSPWLTVGYWKNNIWPSYGYTSYNSNEIKIDVDYAVLKSYYSKWQFQVQMKRYSAAEPSASLHKLSFFVSDQKTTDNVNITSIVNDKPAAIYIDTEHFHQYSLDAGIGGNICSPTSVSMVLRSYGIAIDPVQFARDNYDNYWSMFGVWPRVVQNAAEHNLNGQVTRYRTWSQAREILAAGGRIVMSVGLPLYAGHLIMLAGFDSKGTPIVHDPARSDGYNHQFNKTSLSQSWFNKGGISYTFYLKDSNAVTSAEDIYSNLLADTYLLNVYPNPFNPQTNIIFTAAERSYTEIAVYDILGREIINLYKGEIEPGTYKFNWNASDLPSGMYLIRTVSGNYVKSVKALLVK